MTPEQIRAYQELFATLCDYACNNAHGRDELDPVYAAVTEGRDGPGEKMRAKYSSCADLAHWAWYRLGFRCDFINREEHKGWKVGVNLNRWCPKPIGSCPLAMLPHAGDEPATGDVIVINNPYGGHVMCVTGWDAENSTVYTAEYGQPGGKIRSHTISSTKSKTLVLGKAKQPLMSLVKLERALDTEALDAPDIDVLKDWQAPEALISLRERIGWMAP